MFLKYWEDSDIKKTKINILRNQDIGYWHGHVSQKERHPVNVVVENQWIQTVLISSVAPEYFFMVKPP